MDACRGFRELGVREGDIQVPRSTLGSGWDCMTPVKEERWQHSHYNTTVPLVERKAKDQTPAALLTHL